MRANYKNLGWHGLGWYSAIWIILLMRYSSADPSKKHECNMTFISNEGNSALRQGKSTIVIVSSKGETVLQCTGTALWVQSSAIETHELRETIKGIMVVKRKIDFSLPDLAHVSWKWMLTCGREMAEPWPFEHDIYLADPSVRDLRGCNHILYVSTLRFDMVGEMDGCVIKCLLGARGDLHKDRLVSFNAKIFYSSSEDSEENSLHPGFLNGTDQSDCFNLPQYIGNVGFVASLIIIIIYMIYYYKSMRGDYSTATFE